MKTLTSTDWQKLVSGKHFEKFALLAAALTTLAQAGVQTSDGAESAALTTLAQVHQPVPDKTDSLAKESDLGVQLL